ncbi:hypothetical protein E1293_10950 [Actinomadura darangshiensis]|uniref:NlpC/P60 domain-containing protein n=1 Tax=Actinomadura darangshiensis TaxID=705336 RepID=A0A4R5BKA2_9ACTN|nr:NlpC/P60 family protein [Actinomadura darangshiensis]TDD85616.1 hypothetical protein E1293_10950 [Actinomadura darangshiensis]
MRRDGSKVAVGIGVAGVGLVGIVAMAVALLVGLVALIFSPVTGLMSKICSPSIGSGVAHAQKALASDAIPRKYFELYRRAGAEWGIPWNVLAGVGYVETKHGTFGASRKDGPNFAGAAGPMQFKQGTFNSYKVDANGNGADRYEAGDAVFSAAKLLKTQFSSYAGLQRNLTAEELKRTIFAYNHGPGAAYRPSDTYVNDVLAAANLYAKKYHLTSDNYLDSSLCSAGLVSGSGPFGRRIAEKAAYYAKPGPGQPHPATSLGVKVPYIWGGNGPPGGFDCSGLAVRAVNEASAGKVSLLRTTQAMWRGQKGVVKIGGDRKDLVRPGDLLFFNDPNAPTHMAIYYGVFKGTRWMVEAPRPGKFVQFADFDARAEYVGALRVTPPPGMEGRSPGTVRAMSRPGPRGGVA